MSITYKTRFSLAFTKDAFWRICDVSGEKMLVVSEDLFSRFELNIFSNLAKVEKTTLSKSYPDFYKDQDEIEI